MATVRKLQSLLDKAKDGTITPSELNGVVSELEAASYNDSSDAYTLLHIAGLAASPGMCESTVRRFLLNHRDPMVIGLALRILCLWWGKTDEWVDKVNSIISGEDWDLEEDARVVALSISGEYLREHENVMLLRSLVDVAHGKNSDELLSEFAIHGVARALGYSHRELLGFPNDQTHLNVADVLGQVEQRIVHEKEN